MVQLLVLISMRREFNKLMFYSDIIDYFVNLKYSSQDDADKKFYENSISLSFWLRIPVFILTSPGRLCLLESSALLLMAAGGSIYYAWMYMYGHFGHILRPEEVNFHLFHVNSWRNIFGSRLSIAYIMLTNACLYLYFFTILNELKHSNFYMSPIW